ncbi:Ger(x)C family spore germination protein [Gracilibacillus marinus]|uniref:Ger(X)C family spore germination protein n=1 Tax=Gracilibacillus marinus TaxID=630535 RepID=A0ABV8VRW9_9BACI
MRKLLSLCMLFILTGCWDLQELTEIGLVTAFAIDIDPDSGEYVLTSQFIRPSAQSPVTTENGDPYVTVSATGKSITELLRNVDQSIDRRSFYAHNKIIIISEEVAKKGILTLFESFQRDQQVRSYVWIGIAKGTKAKELMESAQSGISMIPANFFYNLFQDAGPDAVASNLLKFYKEAIQQGNNPVIGVLELNQMTGENYSTIKLKGSSIFKKDELVGFLNDEETTSYNWFEDRLENSDLGSLIVEDKGVPISLNIIKNQRTVIPKITNNGEIVFKVTLRQHMELAEQQKTYHFKAHRDIQKLVLKVQKLAESEIEKRLKELFNKAQSEFQTDFLGFGDLLRKYEPQKWNEVKDNWEKVFSDVKFEIEVVCEIENTGLVRGTLEPSL